MKENYILRGGNIFYSIYDLRLVKKKKKIPSFVTSVFMN